MKSLSLLLFLLLSTTTGFSQPPKQYPSKALRKAFYQNLANRHNSPAIREIFNSDKNDNFEKYIDGFTEKELLKSYSTVIHELLHGYNQFENDTFYYFVEPGIMIPVQAGKHYNSTELNRFLRKGQQDSIFRYAL